MSQGKQTQTNFTAGELSPRLFGRTDLAKFQNGLATCKNFIPQKQGGDRRRPGTKYVAAAKGQTILDKGASDKAVRLIPFNYSVDEQYVLEFGGKNSATTYPVLTATAGAALLGKFTIEGDVASEFPHKRRFTIADSAANDGTYSVRFKHVSGGNTIIRVYEAVPADSGESGTITVHIGYIRFFRDNDQLEASAGVPTEIDSIWDETHIRELKFCQSASYLFFAHPDFRPQTLVRDLTNEEDVGMYGDNENAAWTLSAFDYFDGPYREINETAVTLAVSDVDNDAGTATVTASTTGIFSYRDVDRLLRIYDQGVVAWWGFKITAKGATSKTATVAIEYGTLPSTVDATKVWRWGAWGDDGARAGWPHSPQFHQERFWFAGTDSEPQTIWSSTIDDYTNFRPSTCITVGESYAGTVMDHHAISVTISDNAVNAIHWLRSDAHGLLCIANSGVFMLKGAEEKNITPSNISLRRQNFRGVDERAAPVNIGNTVLYVTSDTKAVRELAYRYEDDQYVAPSMSLLADHIALAGILDTAIYTYPDDILWCVDGDGSLLGLTYEREEDVVAWHEHVMGGTYDSGQAEVEAIASIRNSNNDELWMVVKRTIGTYTVRYIEYMVPYHEIGDDHEDAFYVDSGITYDSTETDTIDGLDHLEGETVDVLGDGLTQTSKAVSSGEITLATAASVVQAGLEYTSTGITMPLYPMMRQDPRGQIQRVTQIHVSLHLSQGGQIGVDGTLYDIEYGTTDLYTGVKTAGPGGSNEAECQITFQQTEPQPMTVRSITFDMQSG